MRGRELKKKRIWQRKGAEWEELRDYYLFQFFKLVKSFVAVFKQIKDTWQGQLTINTENWNS